MGAEIETRGLKGLYRWDDLLDIIQASEEELRTGLKGLAGVEEECGSQIHGLSPGCPYSQLCSA